MILYIISVEKQHSTIVEREIAFVASIEIEKN